MASYDVIIKYRGNGIKSFKGLCQLDLVPLIMKEDLKVDEFHATLIRDNLKKGGN